MKNEKDNTKRYAPVVAVICTLTVFVSACCAFLIASGIKPDFRESVKENVNNFLYQEKTDSASEAPQENLTARVMLAGNNLIYRSIYTCASSLGAQSSRAYDFAPIYENMKSIISEADIAAINQSSVISSNLPVSTYPKFCSPAEAGDALYDMGFTVINHANKNVFDKDIQGAEDALDYWQTKNALVTGLYRSETDRNAVKYKDVNGIKIAFIGVTDFVQSEISAQSEINVINLGDKNRSKAEVYNQLKEMIKTAKETADAVAVYVCFGDSTSNEVSSSQQQTVDYLVSFGADLIVGCGINTVQKAERIVRDDKSSAVVFYSLGNFLSAEEKKENMLGAVADVVFEKNGVTGETIVKSAKAIPVVTYYETGYKNFSILPAENLSDSDLASHALNSYYGGFNLQYVNDTFAEIFTPIADADFAEAPDEESTDVAGEESKLPVPEAEATE